MEGTAHRYVAVIPARGGSKRIPRKNLRNVDGRPLIAWAIDACLRADLFERVVVSTDDHEIADVASAAGAEVPFMRPSRLADDHTPVPPVMGRALEDMGIDADDPVLACCVLPTAVGLLPGDLSASAAAMAAGPSAAYLVAVTGFAHPVQRALRLGPDGQLTMVDETTVLTRSQDLEPLWHDAGQFVWGSAATWMSGLSVLTHACGFVLPRWRVVDLDDEDDLARAGLVHRLIAESALG